MSWPVLRTVAPSPDGLTTRTPDSSSAQCPSVGTSRPLREGSQLDVQVHLGRIADLLAEASDICRDLGRIELDVAPERALMEPVESVRFLTAKDIAHRIQVDEKTIRRWHQAGRLPKGLTIGSVLRWRADDIDAWLEARLG